MSADDLEQIKRIKRAHETLWLSLDHVTAVGIGTTPSGRTGLIVSVSDSPETVREQIPRSIDGIDIDVQTSGELKAL